ncbi:MAG TPA: hypothetical protein VLG25_00930 [Patescibacteria group bacterium]|nr:hypothetical protein [Patescibacteria group bacterium]
MAIGPEDESRLIFNPKDLDEEEHTSPPELRLIVNNSPDGAFFVLETDRQPNISDLVEVAVDGNAQLLLMMALQEVGLMGDFATIESSKQQYNYLLHLGTMDETQRTLFQHLEKSLGHYDEANRRIHVARDFYKAEYLGGEEKGEPDVAKLRELYARTDDFNDSSILRVFESLSERALMETDQGYRDTVNTADRTARLLILDEIYGSMS